MIGQTRFQILALCSLLYLATDGGPTSQESDEENLDALINEFIKDTQDEMMTQSDSTSGIIPLNAQPKFLKTDKCNCTKFYMCDVEDKKESEEMEEGADLSVINIRLNVPEGGCAHYLDICCEKIKEAASIKEPVSMKPKSKVRICGDRNVGGVGFRILGGKDGEAQFGEFPWMAAITEKIPPRYPDEKSRQTFLCGGSLIHPRAILTTAHCFNKTTSNANLRVRLGEWDTQTTKELYPHQDAEVEMIIMHEKYSRRQYLKNDIAIVILKDEVELSPNIAPICLPPVGLNLDGVRCHASGWGKDEFSQEGLYQNILKRVDLPIVPRAECEKELQNFRLGSRFKLHESFVCAGGEIGSRKDTCTGDGGSPLVCQMPGNSYYVQYGIVSWGLGCGNDIPAVYVNVPKFVPWIDEKLTKLGLDTAFYHP